VRLNSVIITFSGFKSGTCQRYSGRVKCEKKARRQKTFHECAEAVLEILGPLSMPLVSWMLLFCRVSGLLQLYLPQDNTVPEPDVPAHAVSIPHNRAIHI
ncbi:hypothetical protein, partial [Salmonella enterica]|uniref:hypothetical protein n=4 Tax=Salmonella enterica TaxID=28901 RepID=UPI0032B4D456